ERFRNHRVRLIILPRPPKFPLRSLARSPGQNDMPKDRCSRMNTDALDALGATGRAVIATRAARAKPAHPPLHPHSAPLSLAPHRGYTPLRKRLRKSTERHDPRLSKLA